MKRVEEAAYAKLNLSLDVLSKRPDGYHNVRMVMQSVSLCDDVTVTVREGGGSISVATDRAYLPTDEGNLAGHAARAWMTACDVTEYDVAITIKKRIPVCAGLGGGSADAAAVLRALNRLLDAPLSWEDLEALGQKIGADVPFCIAGGTSLAQGKGEELIALDPLPDAQIVICKPQFSFSTPELFSRINCAGIKLRPDTDGILAALRVGKLRAVSQRLYNVFEDVLGKKREAVDAIKRVLYDHGALGAAMSGTGSAVFGIFDRAAEAAEAQNALRRQYPECWVAQNVPRLAFDV